MTQKNRNGAEMCHAYKCRKHKRLTRAFNGRFCAEHLAILGQIRFHLLMAKRLGLLESENYWRQQEIKLRKYHDANHMKYKAYIEAKINTDA